MKKTTTIEIMKRKRTGPKIAVLTAYDYPTALLTDRAEIDMILVGDSLGMVVLGYEDTVSVTMDEMIHHAKAVTRAAKRALVVGDMPFGSYNTEEQAVENAVRFMKEGRVDAVKLERGTESAPVLGAVVKAGIPVQGHIGLTPQTISAMGGFKVQGKNAEAARALLEDARAVEDAGCFSLVLEGMPKEIAEMITDEISIPTIGIGAGSHCDGQVLVTHDLLGLFDRFTPKFVKQYAKIGDVMLDAMARYKSDVYEGRFPEGKHSFTIAEDEMEKLTGER